MSEEHTIAFFLYTTDMKDKQMEITILQKIEFGHEKRASALFLAYSYFQAILSLVILINGILIKKRCNHWLTHSLRHTHIHHHTPPQFYT